MGFAYRDGMLHAEQVSLDEIARRFGTPCYVYSSAAAVNSACGITMHAPAASKARALAVW